jgi:hypothetical protein
MPMPSREIPCEASGTLLGAIAEGEAMGIRKRGKT